MGSRENILARLRAAPKPFTGIPPMENRRHVTPPETVPDLKERFLLEAKKLACKVAEFDDSNAAIQHIVEIIRAEGARGLPSETRGLNPLPESATPLKITAWDFQYIPLPGLKGGLEQAGIEVVDSNDASVRVGITGAVAALAATGSIIVQSGAGRPRKVSLLPYAHLAVIHENQLVLDFETWMQQQREKGLGHFRQIANTVVISGSSRTADIAMEIVMGAHGPAEVYIVIMK